MTDGLNEVFAAIGGSVLDTFLEKTEKLQVVTSVWYGSNDQRLESLRVRKHIWT